MSDILPVNPSLRSVNPAHPAGPQIFEVLLHAIVRMDLVPGQALSEAELAQALGASRTPVRAALQELRDLGLVETWPSRRTFVSPLNAGRVRAAQFIREALEVSTVHYLATSGMRGRDAIEANLEAQEKAVAMENAAAFVRLDDAFHGLLAASTGFDRLAEVLEREKAQLDRLRGIALRNSNRFGELLVEHRAIFRAVEAGDADGATTAMRAHLRSVLDVLGGLSRDHAAYFTYQTT